MAVAHTRNSWLEVDLAAVDRNARALRRAAPGAVLCGVVKKDAYGLGAVAVGRTLVAAGAGMLAVYEPGEALPLIEAGMGGPFLVLHGSLGPSDPWGAAAEAGALHFQVGSFDLLQDLDACGRSRGLRIPVHVHLDTGMSREGFRGPDGVGAVAAMLAGDLPGLRLAGVMTHLSTADSDPARAAAQVARFDALLARIPAANPLPEGVVVHVCNSYGTLRERSWHRQMIRPGIGLFGYAQPTLDADAGAAGPTQAGEPGQSGEPGNSGKPGLEGASDLEPVARWVSRISSILTADAGAAVGYGATETLERDTPLGLVPVGYADGYPLALSGRGVMLVRETPCRVVGRVSMDQVMIDLSAVPQAENGDPVEVYGRDPQRPNALPRMAAAAGTHAYELLTRIHPRVPREHRGGRADGGDEAPS